VGLTTAAIRACTTRYPRTLLFTPSHLLAQHVKQMAKTISGPGHLDILEIRMLKEHRGFDPYNAIIIDPATMVRVMPTTNEIIPLADRHDFRLLLIG
jgi:hypothetical protein